SRRDGDVGMNPDLRRGNLQVQVLPFVEQERYDELLWACDVNFVRGEDSCVRAQWAGKPFVWQIYPQHDAVHWEKLQAFLNLYSASLSPAASEAVQGLWREWNGEGGAGAAWPAYAAVRGELDARALVWARELAENNLALNLLDFYQEVGRMRAFEIEGQ
ncbi:MAG: elongation factor P maturation arginine rhamnosyltransferase EarP, partial [Gallionella sp.]